MSNRGFLFDLPTDKVTGTWSQSSGTVNASYPLTNIDDGKPWNPVIFTVNPTRISCDHGSAVTVDLVSFINCNFPASLSVTVNRGSSVGSASMTATVTTSGPTASGFPSNPFVDLTTVSGYGAYRYTWIDIGSTATLLSLGLVRLTGTRRESEVSLRFGAKDPVLFPLTERTTDAGTQTGYSRGTRARRLSGQMTLTDAGFATLKAQYEACFGRLNPFLFILDPAVNEAMWVRWGQDAQSTFERTQSDYGVSQLPIDLEELGRGLVP